MNDSSPALAADPRQIYVASVLGMPLRQGEIISNLIQHMLDVRNIESAKPQIVPERHPYAIIVSQGCDLDWDFRARVSNDPKQQHKLMPSVLLCMLVAAAELQSSEGAKPIWSHVKKNKSERYHFLQRVKSEDDAEGTGIDELGADFKRYFTVPTAELYFQINSGTANRRCRLESPFLEHFTTRFGYYQYRIALPEDHYSE